MLSKNGWKGCALFFFMYYTLYSKAYAGRSKAFVIVPGFIIQDGEMRLRDALVLAQSMIEKALQPSPEAGRVCNVFSWVILHRPDKPKFVHDIPVWDFIIGASNHPPIYVGDPLLVKV